MGMQKYLEDNLEIAEERVLLAQEDNEQYANFPLEEEVRRVYVVSTRITKLKINPPKKHKRKKKKIVCLDCGETFFFTGGEQKYYEKCKLSEPKRCPNCRQKRKENARAHMKNEEAHI